MIAVKRLATAADRKVFLRLPWQIYAGDRAWAPPLLVEEEKFIDRRRHPFFRHGQAEFFLAYRDGVAVGRLVVSEDPLANAANNESVACVGLFECIDDLGVARALFAEAAIWAAGRGLATLRGPVDYSTNYPVGLLLDGFELPQRVQMKHNPAYYRQLFEDCGFAKAKDLYSWWGESHEKIQRWRQKVERLSRHSPVTIRAFDRKHKQRDIAKLKTLSLELLAANWGYVKMTDAEFDHFVDGLSMVPPELILLAEDKGECIGLSVTVPDFNEATRPLNGRLTRYGLPLGLLKFLRLRRKIRSARMALIGVKEAYRFEGIAERMILQTFDYGGRVLGYTGAELGWTFADNAPMVRSIDAVCGTGRRTFRIFERPLAEPSRALT